tara:strand:- start:1651 stop:3834 length:2184 start_codon:yes stop_codon:yes gene_type:complete
VKKIFYLIILLIIISAFLLITFLSTTGLETKKFNKFISEKIESKNIDVSLNLDVIEFKLDIKQLGLFLNIKEPDIKYKNTSIPAENVKIYIDFISTLKSQNQIEKISVNFNEVEINQIKEIFLKLKPSNLNSFINNRILGGRLNAELEIYLDQNNIFKNFITRGIVSDLKAEIYEQLNFENTNFNFFADKTDVLISNFFSDIGPVQLKQGDLKLILHDQVSLVANFITNINYTDHNKKYLKILNNHKILKNINSIKGNLNNNLSLELDETYKVKNYNLSSNGKLKNLKLILNKPIENFFSNKEIEKINFSDISIQTNLDLKKKYANIKGKYSFNTENFLNFKLENNTFEDHSKMILKAEYDEKLELKLVNYQKQKDKIANISINLERKKNQFNFNKIDIEDGKNFIIIEGLKFKKNNFDTLEKISIKTFNNDIKNNDFTINYGNKISIKGDQFDARNLPKIFSAQQGKNRFNNLSKEIEIDLKYIIVPLSEKLKNFRLIGLIENGKFIKISSKGDFGNDNFLDISMKNDKKNKKKYLEIYSDLTKPLLTEFNFFKGLSGGKLLYSSIIEDKNSISKLKIEDFKVINAPGMIKLLTVADLRGLADMAKGDGITFDELEIKMEKNEKILEIKELLALGPSISVLMEGYQDKEIISLRGTLVPAKSLNNIISKIPLIGDIVIPKEAGEGLFGISFKMKGPKNEMKTTINPIRTLTPRFIQKIIDKKKNIN